MLFLGLLYYGFSLMAGPIMDNWADIVMWILVAIAAYFVVSLFGVIVVMVLNKIESNQKKLKKDIA